MGSYTWTTSLAFAGAAAAYTCELYKGTNGFDPRKRVM